MGDSKSATFYDQHPFDWVPVDEAAEIDSVVSRPLVELIQTLDVNSLVLDIGCGPGRVLGFLKLRGIRCIGLDRSRVSLGLATKRYDVAGAVGDNLHLPFADGTADVVISDGVIHHTEDPWGAFAENFRILKAGGRVYLGVSRRLQARRPVPDALQVSGCADSTRVETGMVETFRHALFSGTVLCGSFCSFERETHLVRGGKPFLRLLRHSQGRISSTPNHRGMVRETAGSHYPI